jgi:hypothetical protein
MTDIGEGMDEKAVRHWADHLGLTMRRRGSGYSIRTRPQHGHPNGEPRKDFRSLRQTVRYLNRWMDRELAKLEDAA